MIDVYEYTGIYLTSAEFSTLSLRDSSTLQTQQEK